jgi:hypothetical protein
VPLKAADKADDLPSHFFVRVQLLVRQFCLWASDICIVPEGTVKQKSVDWHADHMASAILGRADLWLWNPESWYITGYGKIARELDS